jgi:hypothetical protein
MKRRALVVTDEAARHPFLASLPPHVRRSASDAARPSNWRQFASNYCASFIAVTVFFA